MVKIVPGPLPQPARRRRNAPTIPTTNLPASGRTGPAPKVPTWIRLGDAGKAWWRWAWSTPQAAAWSDGDRPMVARRARLEDGMAESPLSAPLMREARELDDRLGLTPKGMAALRWKIVADEQPDTADASTAQQSGVTALDPRRLRRQAAG